MEKRAVVVQILTYRTEGIESDLDRLFDSLARTQAPEGGWAIVIVDNPSPLGNLEQYLRTAVLPRVGIDLPLVTVHTNPTNTGFAGGHEDALRLSAAYEPTYVYLLNQDTHVAPDFLVMSVAAAEANSRAVLVQSRIMMGDEVHVNSCGNAMHFLGFGFTLGYKDTFVPGTSIETQRHGLPMFYASGAGVLLRMALLPKIGGMFAPSYFMYHEDLDLSWRTRLAGFDVDYAEASVVYHHYEFSRSIQKFYWMERNRHLTNFINYQIPTVLLLLPGLAIMEVGTLLFAFRSGWWREKFCAWKFFVRPSTWQFIAIRRKMVRGLRVKSDREMLRHMVGVITAQDVQNPLVTYIMNPLFTAYFRALQWIVRW